MLYVAGGDGTGKNISTKEAEMAKELSFTPVASLLGVMGSRAYGLAHANSDYDKLGVFVAPVREVLGLFGASVCENSVVTHEPDLSLHELAKFCRLGLKSNPTLLELLWLPEYEVCDEVGAELVSIRESFPCTDAVRGGWGGFAGQLLKKSRSYSSRECDEQDLAHMNKNARHCWRLLLQGIRYLGTGELVVDVSSQRDEIFSMGELAVTDIGRFTELAEAKLVILDTCESVLPERPRSYKVNKFLVNTRLGAL